MLNSTSTTKKSRLGALLVHRNLITQQQLYEALDLQEKLGKKIGEILIEQGWMSEVILNQILHSQSRCRLITAFSAILLAPLHSTTAQPSKILPSMTQQQASSIDILNEIVSNPNGYEHFLETVSESLANDDHQATRSTINALTSALLPGSNILEAKIEVQGAVYGEEPHLTSNVDGSLTLRFPTSIHQVAFRDIKTADEQGHEHIGDLVINNIEFGENHNLTIQWHTPTAAK